MSRHKITQNMSESEEQLRADPSYFAYYSTHETIPFAGAGKDQLGLLSGQLQSLTKDASRLKAENEQVVAIKSDIDGMRKDLVDMRRDYEMVKKANEEHMIQKELMEKNLISMAREIEKLRDKCTLLLNDTEDMWTFTGHWETSSIKYITALEDEVETLRKSVINLRSKLQMGLEIEKHLKKVVLDLKNKKIFFEEKMKMEIPVFRGL
ncbi:hypothetical protein L1887_10590 [Cichorium endivia]|nr:hypothetical protein L1887_10590 [Cichorium endivia]